MKLLNMIVLFIFIFSISVGAADETAIENAILKNALIKVKDPSTFVKENIYTSRVSYLKIIAEQTSIPLTEYQTALRNHFIDHMKDKNSDTILFTQKNLIILKKYFHELEQTQKPITDPTDLKMLSGYLSIISAKADKMIGNPIINSMFSFDESVPVGIKLDPDGKLSSLNIPYGDKPAVSLDINGQPAYLRIRKDGIQFYPNGWIDSSGGYMTLKSGSFSLEQFDPKRYGEWNGGGVVMKDAASSISLHNSERSPLFIKDSVTPGAGEWMAAMRALGSEATVKPGEATFTKNGYVALRRTDGKDIYLTPPADQGGKIAWGGEKAPSGSNMWIKSLSDKNPNIFGNAGEVTSINRKVTPTFYDWTSIHAMQSDPKGFPESSSVTFTRDGPYPRITSDLSNFPEGTTFTGKLDETGTPTNIWTVKEGLGCHQSALTCVQLPSVSMISGAPNPKEAEMSGAMQRLAASRAMREAAEVRRSLPSESGLIGESEYQRAASIPGSEISLGQGRLFRDLKPTGERVFAELQNDPDLAATMKNPALRTKLEQSYSSLLGPLEGWIKDNYKSVLIKSSKEENGFYNKWIGYNDLSVKVDVKVMEYKGLTLSMVIKVAPGPESKSQWRPQYIYMQNPDPTNKDLVKVIQKVQQTLKRQ